MIDNKNLVVLKCLFQPDSLMMNNITESKGHMLHLPDSTRQSPPLLQL